MKRVILKTGEIVEVSEFTFYLLKFLLRPKVYSNPNNIGLNDILWFGKYKGIKMKDIVENDPGYVEWMIREFKKYTIGDDVKECLR